MNMKHDYQHIYDQCKDHMHAYVLAEMNDGSKVDGIVTGLDDEYVYFAVPVEGDYITSSPYSSPSPSDYYPYNRERPLGYGYPGYGYGGFGGYGGYGYPGYGGGGRPRRFRRLVLPLAALTALSILPWY